MATYSTAMMLNSNSDSSGVLGKWINLTHDSSAFPRNWFDSTQDSSGFWKYWFKSIPGSRWKSFDSNPFTNQLWVVPKFGTWGPEAFDSGAEVSRRHHVTESARRTETVPLLRKAKHEQLVHCEIPYRRSPHAHWRLERGSSKIQ